MITQARRTAGGTYTARNGRREAYGDRTWYELRTTNGTKVVVQDGQVWKGRMYGELLHRAENNRKALAWARAYLAPIDKEGK